MYSWNITCNQQARVTNLLFTLVVNCFNAVKGETIHSFLTTKFLSKNHSHESFQKIHMVAKSRTCQENSKRTYSITWYRTHFRMVFLLRIKLHKCTFLCSREANQTITDILLTEGSEVSIIKREIFKMDSWVLLSGWVCSH